MYQNQFSMFERIGHTILGNLPFRNIIIENLNKFRIKQIKKLKTPINVVFYVTDGCNLRCKHCFYWKNLKNKNDELKIDKIKKIAKSFKHPLHMLSLTGGEPFMRQDIVEICNLFYKYNNTKRINIATNGILTGKIVEATKIILRNNPTKRFTIFISLDGLQSTHDSIRNYNGSFEKAIKTIKELKKIKNKNLSIFVATTITEQNFEELPELIQFVKALKVIHKFNLLRNNSTVHNIDPSLLQDFDPQHAKLPKNKDLEKVFQIIKNNGKSISNKVETLKIKYSIDLLKNFHKIKCLATFTDMVLFPKGDISVCEPTNSFGNLKDWDYNVYKAWDSKHANKRKSKLKSCSCIQSCNLLNSMKYDTKTLKKIL